MIVITECCQFVLWEATKVIKIEAYDKYELGAFFPPWTSTSHDIRIVFYWQTYLQDMGTQNKIRIYFIIEQNLKILIYILAFYAPYFWEPQQALE